MATDFYAYAVVWSEIDQEFVGTCAEFRSLSHLDATQDGALRGIRALVSEVVKDLKESGEPIPEAVGRKVYSGSFVTRVPPHLHQRLALEAAQAGVSLNRLVSFRLAAGGDMSVAPVRTKAPTNKRRQRETA